LAASDSFDVAHFPYSFLPGGIAHASVGMAPHSANPEKRNIRVSLDWRAFLPTLMRMPNKPTRPLSPIAGSTILFEGDSLTRFAGPGLDTWAWMRLTGAHYGYPEKIGDWVFCNRPDLNLSCRIGAIGGSILADVLERFPRIAAPVKPGIVVVTIGANDLARSVPIDLFRSQAEEYCTKLRDLCAGRVLYLGNVFGGKCSAESLELGAQYFRNMSEVVEAHDGLAIDLGQILARKSAALTKLHDLHTIYHDGTHFNPVGHEIIASVVLRALGLITMPGDPDYPITRELE
jgi:lysophospholipase L1-like esterase